VPVKDTIKSADEDGFVKKTLERSTLWAVQTPQAFLKDIIMKAHKKAAETGLRHRRHRFGERMGMPVRVVMGSYNNIKITTREDLIFAEALATRRDNNKNTNFIKHQRKARVVGMINVQSLSRSLAILPQ